MNRPLEPSKRISKAIIMRQQRQKYSRLPRVCNQSVVEAMQRESREARGRCEDDLGCHGDFVGRNEHVKGYIPNMSIVV